MVGGRIPGVKVPVGGRIPGRGGKTFRGRVLKWGGSHATNMRNAKVVPHYIPE